MAPPTEPLEPGAVEPDYEAADEMAEWACEHAEALEALDAIAREQGR